MTTRTLRPPQSTFDRDGRPILLIRLAHTSVDAKVFPEDYARLLSEGFSPNWCFNRLTVKVSDWRHNAPRVARLIMDISPGDPVQVRHIDGNPLNLRKDNLRVLPMKPRKPHRHRPI